MINEIAAPGHLHNDPASYLVQNAQAIAIRACHTQSRKDGTPALLHPLAVSTHLSLAGICDERIHATAWLHDVLEENPEQHDELLAVIHQVMPEDVTKHILMLTDDMRLPDEQRKAAQLKRFDAAPHAVRIVKLADLLANLQSLPPFWDGPKRIARSNHCWKMLARLANTNTYLESRIRHELLHAPWGLPISLDTTAGKKLEVSQ